jgi:putative transposase
MADMRKSKFTEEQIIGFLKQAEAGLAVAEICRKGGFSDATFYKWRAKFGGMEASDARRLRELEAENAKLKSLLAAPSADVRREAVRALTTAGVPAARSRDLAAAMRTLGAPAFGSLVIATSVARVRMKRKPAPPALIQGFWIATRAAARADANRPDPAALLTA